MRNVGIWKKFMSNYGLRISIKRGNRRYNSSSWTLRHVLKRGEWRIRWYEVRLWQRDRNEIKNTLFCFAAYQKYDEPSWMGDWGGHVHPEYSRGAQNLQQHHRQVQPKCSQVADARLPLRLQTFAQVCGKTSVPSREYSSCAIISFAKN